MNKNVLHNKMQILAQASYGKEFTSLTPREFWQILSRAIVSELAPNWEKTRCNYLPERQAHYFSAEFLVGRSLLNNLVNLNLYETVSEFVTELGYDLTNLLEEESDPGLGNGGLGRLSACFLDSSATMGLPVTGYGILYHFGLFRQEIENGFQREYPDNWIGNDGYPFMVPRRDEKVLVQYEDLTVYAIPYDLPVTGFGTDNINMIRLWDAEPAQDFDFNLFNSQRFDDAVIERNRVRDICRVLYPNDSTYDGKVLRLRQQYFFVSASLQYIVNTFKRVHGTDFSKFPQFNTIQLNDTHPVLAIPELMRLLIDENRQSWDEAWSIVQKTFAFTNHTMMEEALEKWDINIFQFLFPRILNIIKQIDLQFEEEIAHKNWPEDLIQELSPIHDAKVHMALLACYSCYSINGVAAIHTNLLKNVLFKDFYKLWPEKFNNKTNGVTPRRWLRACNPLLAELLTERLGNEDWVTDLTLLQPLEKEKENTNLIRSLLEIKTANKKQLIDFIKEHEGIELDSNFLFDVQIKRLHEYKRQFLNGLYILDRYFKLKDNPHQNNIVPVAYIFGAKAAPGYFRAKAIIKFLTELAELINEDSDINQHMRVVFLHNYNVSLAEKIFPAADLSEQISTVGMEASGTGNMKFMMNGALTLGTYDGANLEILDQVGAENCFMFGPQIDDFPATMSYYNSQWQYNNVEGLKRVVDALVDGTISDNRTGMFQELYNSLLTGSQWQAGDPFYILGDFEAYRNARNYAHAAYLDQIEWGKKCWVNIVNSGRFSSDRTIKEYAAEIWDIKPSFI
ncbi:MAG TPA: glycogen/starch/alpha-glucan phosphorylase [Clostridiaceae bacterium]|nr:glycogen/starch/alpha-glucan phosphorylase [Clostridiaceae bacterium]